MILLRSFYYWTVALGYIGPVLLITLIRTFFESPEAYDPWLRQRLQTLFKLLNSDPVLEFSEELPTDRPLIYMANHSSLIDVPLLKAVIPSYFKGIIAHDQLDYILYGSVVKRMGNIPIQRDNIRASLNSFKTARDQIDNGVHITVLPEGNRSLDGKLLPFKKLPFQFAKESGASIVPIAISGVFAMKNKASLNLKSGSLIVRFGPVISSEAMSQLEIDDIMDMTRERILSRLESFEAGTN
jgi:1-acyl-sn-glycerol-3-phosphate acyltransferase